MDDYTDPRPDRPQITLEAVLLAIELGGQCPHRLAAIFDVHVLNPDLIHACNDLVRLGVIKAGEPGHVGPSGVTCTPIVLTSQARRTAP